MKGKLIQIKYMTQVAARSPSFAFFCNLPQYIQESYKRFLENRLREKFDFTGVPIEAVLPQKIAKNGFFITRSSNIPLISYLCTHIKTC